jgi:bifunctional non-homologous end joining protein LigD
LRAERGRRVSVQPAAGGNGRRSDRSARVLRLRSYVPERREHRSLPLIERKERLERLFNKQTQGLRYSEHVVTDGPRFREHACKLGLEGIISKRIDRPYAPGDRELWVKSKCLNREEFVVVGWTDPAGSRTHIGALPLGYYTEDGRLHYAGRAGTGMAAKELKRLAGVLAPLQVARMPVTRRRPATAGSALRSRCPRCTGRGRSWWWK